jgi:hypothetical protein
MSLDSYTPVRLVYMYIVSRREGGCTNLNALHDARRSKLFDQVKDLHSTA